MGRPRAGWYADPGGSGGTRYWDGERWTAALRPPLVANPAHAPVAPAPRPMPDAPDPRGRVAARGTAPTGLDQRSVLVRLVVAGSVMLALLVGGVVVYNAWFQRGAATPIAAIEAGVDAFNAQDVLGILRLVAPDELDAVRSVWDHVPEAAQTETAWGIADVAFTLGTPRPVTEGVEVVPVQRVAYTVQSRGGLATGLDRQAGEVVTEDLWDEPHSAIVVVERGGRWFVSPLGTLLEVLSRDAGFGGASPAVPRAGSDTPRSAVEDVFRNLWDENPAGLLDLLDPEELQVLDHYRAFLADGQRPASTPVRVDASIDGSVVNVHRVEAIVDGQTFGLDIDSMCVDDPGYRDCARDRLLEDLPFEVPWRLSALRALVEPQPAELRLGTVERGERHYISLASTLEATLDPYLERLGEHGIAGLVQPHLSPQASEVVGTPGQVIELPLHDNWNAIRFDQDADLRACPPDGSDLWQVAGNPVVTERIGFDLGSAAGRVPGLVVGVVGAQQVGSIQVRLVEGHRPC